MTNSSDTESLTEKISDIARAKWQSEKKPVLLSQLGAELLNHGVNHREVLKGVNLSAFLKLNEDKFTVVRDSAKPLKVGVIPAGETYEFDEEQIEGVQTDGPKSIPQNLKKSRGALYSFINELSKLPNEVRQGVVKPVEVLIHLMEGE